MLASNSITIRHDLRPGDLGRVVVLHGEVYESIPGFGLSFEAYVAKTIAEYVLDNQARGRIWLAERGGELVGCVAIALRGEGVGQLRWVLVDPSARGIGLGRKLVETAIRYCVDQACTSVYLETTDGLRESQALYEALGFETLSNELAELWDGVRPLIRMRLPLNSSNT